MSNFSFVDIGTSDFRYTIPNNNEFGIYVEPIDFYLDSIEDYPNTIKARLAITDKDGTVPIYFVPPDAIKKYDLPFFIRGCNKEEKYTKQLKENVLKEVY